MTKPQKQAQLRQKSLLPKRTNQVMWLEHFEVKMMINSICSRGPAFFLAKHHAVIFQFQLRFSCIAVVGQHLILLTVTTKRLSRLQSHSLHCRAVAAKTDVFKDVIALKKSAEKGN